MNRSNFQIIDRSSIGNIAKEKFDGKIFHATVYPNKGLVKCIDEIASVLNFPEYYSHNRSSFEDCLSDLNWINEKSVTIKIHVNDEINRDKSELLVIDNIKESIISSLTNFDTQSNSQIDFLEILLILDTIDNEIT